MDLLVLNASELEANETLNQVTKYFNISLSNLTHQSEETQMKLFDLYEAYRTREREQLMAYKFVAYVVGTLIILSNITVVISSGLILKKGQQPKSTYLLLGNVSLADTIIGISVIFGAIVDENINSNSMCIFQIGMLVCPAMVSIFSVGLIAIDRYIYILHGLYYQRWFNTTKVRIGILCIWMIGATLGFMPATGWIRIFVSCLPAMGWTGKTFTDYRCWYVAVFPSSLLIILSTVVLSVIVMVCILYILILHSAVKTVDRIRKRRYGTISIAYVNKAFEDECKKIEEAKTKITFTVPKETKEECSIEMCELKRANVSIPVDQRNVANMGKIKRKVSKVQQYYGQAKVMNSNPSKLKAVKTVMIVILCFVGTWAPYYVTVILFVKCDIMKHGYACVPLELLTLGPLFLLGCCNCLCDPVIYAWRHSGFKRTLRRMYWKQVFKMRNCK